VLGLAWLGRGGGLQKEILGRWAGPLVVLWLVTTALSCLGALVLLSQGASGRIPWLVSGARGPLASRRWAPGFRFSIFLVFVVVVSKGRKPSWYRPRFEVNFDHCARFVFLARAID